MRHSGTTPREGDSPAPISITTANFAGASPSAVHAERRRAADELARQLRSAGTDIVLAQEVPDDGWLAAWVADGYDVALGDGPTYRVRSAVLWRSVLPIQRTSLLTASYHGTYLAAAELTVPGSPPTLIVSVHASPRPVTDNELATWDLLCPAVAPARPWRRRGAGRAGNKWFDADLVLGTLALHSGGWGAGPGCQVIAAGDLNECRAWDVDHPGEWGADYFAHVTAAGYVDVTWEAWREERPTCLAAGRALQLDHVLATAGVAAGVREPQVGTLDVEAVAAGRSSDHAPISFSFDPGRA